MQRYVHTSTGNYNPVTAKVYTDLGLFTADPEIVADVSDIFNYLTGYSNQRDYRSLVVAPMQLRTRVRELIRRETEHARAGRPARIIAKMNAVTDDQMIRELYSASQAGVEIDLIVRGICSLRPGIPGVSERIRVRSIVGRFLEHSRVFWFENGGHEELYLSSADLMERNLDRRVETMTPIRDRAAARAPPQRGPRRLPARHRRRVHARLDRALPSPRDRHARRLQRAAGAVEALRRSARPVGSARLRLAATVSDRPHCTARHSAAVLSARSQNCRRQRGTPRVITRAHVQPSGCRAPLDGMPRAPSSMDPSIVTPRGPLAAALAGTQNSTPRRRTRRPAAAPLVAVPARDVAPTDLRNPALYINRELGWLEFNERVLDQARDTAHPLLERVKFLAITASNLDEFFMIRVSTTLKKLNAGTDEVAPDGYNTEQQLAAMQARARRMLRDQLDVWADLRTALDARRDSPPRPLGLERGHRGAPVRRVRARDRAGADAARVRAGAAAADPRQPQHERRGGGGLPGAHTIRPRQRARRAAAVHRAARAAVAARADVRDARRRGLRQHPRAVPRRHGGRRASLPRRARRRPRARSRRRAGPAADGRGQPEAAAPRPDLAAAARGATCRRACGRCWWKRWAFRSDEVVADARTARPRRLGAADAPAPPRAEGRAVLAAQPLAPRRGSHRHLRSHPRRGSARPPSLRVVRVGRDVRPRRGRRSPRGGDQDDALPHRRAIAAARPADPGGRERQAGGGAGGDQGAPRRAQQHPVGAASRVARHPRRLRVRRPEDAREAVPGGQAGVRRHPALRPHQHRQLQRGDRARLHRPGAVHRRPGSGGRRLGDLQQPDRLLRRSTNSTGWWWRRATCGRR